MAVEIVRSRGSYIIQLVQFRSSKGQDSTFRPQRIKRAHSLNLAVDQSWGACRDPPVPSDHIQACTARFKCFCPCLILAQLCDLLNLDAEKDKQSHKWGSRTYDALISQRFKRFCRCQTSNMSRHQLGQYRGPALNTGMPSWQLLI